MCALRSSGLYENRFTRPWWWKWKVVCVHVYRAITHYVKAVKATTHNARCQCQLSVDRGKNSRRNHFGVRVQCGIQSIYK